MAPKKKLIKAAVKKTSAAKVATKKVTASPFVAHKTKLVLNKPAPDFLYTTSTGNTLSLASLKGKKIILYFYPKDDTPGCTASACSLRDDFDFFNSNNYTIIGVSADDEKSHEKFKKKYNLQFNLIADVNKEIIRAYDVWGKKMFMGKIYEGIIRTTFLINEKGNLEKIITAVNTSKHAEQIRT